MNPGRLHSALSLSGPTPANLRTCSGMSGALPWSIRRWPRRRAGGARRHRPAGIDRPMLDRKPRHPDEKSSSSCPSACLCRGDRKKRSLRLCGVTLIMHHDSEHLNSLVFLYVSTNVYSLKLTNTDNPGTFHRTLCFTQEQVTHIEVGVHC